MERVASIGSLRKRAGE